MGERVAADRPHPNGALDGRADRQPQGGGHIILGRGVAELLHRDLGLSAHGEQRIERAGALAGDLHPGPAFHHPGAAAAFAHHEPVIGQLVQRPLGGDSGHAVEFRQFLLARQGAAGAELTIDDALAHDQVDLMVKRRAETPERPRLAGRWPVLTADGGRGRAGLTAGAGETGPHEMI